MRSSTSRPGGLKLASADSSQASPERPAARAGRSLEGKDGPQAVVGQNGGTPKWGSKPGQMETWTKTCGPLLVFKFHPYPCHKMLVLQEGWLIIMIDELHNFQCMENVWLGSWYPPQGCPNACQTTQVQDQTLPQ